MCVEFGLCKFIRAGDEKSEPTEVPSHISGLRTETLKIWSHILFLEHQMSIHAKLEPANTIIDSKTLKKFKNEWEIFLGHPVGGDVNIFLKTAFSKKDS